MTEFLCDNPHLQGVYPFNWIEPPCPYKLLEESEIQARLDSYEIRDLPQGVNKRLDGIKFQPYPTEESPNEDEYHVSVIPLSTAQASGNLFILLDGHAGPHTSAHARTHLPPIITSKLQELPATAWTERSSDDAVAQCLTRSILEYDKSLEQAFIAALPSTDQLAGMSQTAVEAIFDDPERLIALQRYVCGSTALVVLQVGKDIWTATVGDCEAILGHKEDDGSWGMIPLHGGPHSTRVNPKEKDIVSEGHPGEEVIVKNRVLGSIAVTRALGDGTFKLPKLYLEKVIQHMPIRTKKKVEALLQVYKTPPYLSAKADTRYHRVPNGEAFLLITTDGLENPEHPDQSENAQEKSWAKTVGQMLDEGEKSNLATGLLRRLWGYGEDGLHRASAFLGLDYPEGHYQDDTTVLITVL